MPDLRLGQYGGYDASNFSARIIQNLYDNIIARDLFAERIGLGKGPQTNKV